MAWSASVGRQTRSNKATQGLPAASGAVLTEELRMGEVQCFADEQIVALPDHSSGHAAVDQRTGTSEFKHADTGGGFSRGEKRFTWHEFWLQEPADSSARS